VKIRTLFHAAVFLTLLLTGCNKPASTPAEIDAAELRQLMQIKTQLLVVRPKDGSGITAYLYGKNLNQGNDKTISNQVIDYIVLKDKNTGQSVKYSPKGDTAQATDYFFTDIWSPDGAWLVLPLGKPDGFAIYNAKTAIRDIETGKPADTIRVWTGEARRYWHNFDRWDGKAAFRFKVELEGSSFPYKYDIIKHRLTCYGTQCERDNHAVDKKGDVPILESSE
jgi:hypothetical protein